MAGILMLLALCIVMALASFLAGALPLSLSLSHSQLRLISSIGIGILVGTSLIVIIPEGIEAAATTSISAHNLAARAPWAWESRAPDMALDATAIWRRNLARHPAQDALPSDASDPAAGPPADGGSQPKAGDEQSKEKAHVEIPAFEIGLSLTLGFALMFLIDRLPRHASNRFHLAPETTHVSLDSLGAETEPDQDEEGRFLGPGPPGHRSARGMATTLGLVIHAAADGIAMGASSTTTDMKLGFIIFIAIMIHKAPAAFGLTSLLLKQGLSKRAARGHLIVFSLAAPLGALSTWLLVTLVGGRHLEGESRQWWTGMLLLFSGGTFLYVAMHAMQEEGASHAGHDHGPPGTTGYTDGNPAGLRKSQGPQASDTLATMAGMFIPLLTQFGDHH